MGKKLAKYSGLIGSGFTLALTYIVPNLLGDATPFLQALAIFGLIGSLVSLILE